MPADGIQLNSSCSRCSARKSDEISQLRCPRSQIWVVSGRGGSIGWHLPGCDDSSRDRCV
jgi:hypothetical protein